MTTTPIYDLVKSERAALDSLEVIYGHPPRSRLLGWWDKVRAWWT